MVQKHSLVNATRQGCSHLHSYSEPTLAITIDDRSALRRFDVFAKTFDPQVWILVHRHHHSYLV